MEDQENAIDIRKRIATYLASPRGDLFASPREEISFSRLSLMARNPYEHHLKYTKRLKSAKESSNLFFGKNMHSALAFFYQDMSMDVEILIDYWRSTVKGSYDNMEYPIEFKRSERKLKSGIKVTQETFEDVEEMGVNMLRAYHEKYAQEDQKRREILAIEAPFWIPLISMSGRVNQKYMLTGIIDLIYRDLETGEVIVEDHKTLGRKMQESTPDTAYQISQYFLGAVSLGYIADKAQFNCLYKTKTPGFDRLQTTRTNEQMLEFMEDANSIAKCISYGIKHRNYTMGLYMSEFKDYILNGDKDSVIQYEPVTLRERFEKGKLEVIDDDNE